MIILQIVWENRNDFDAILQCEHCQATQLMKNGYHDDRFHSQVIPAIKCLKCLKRNNETIPEGISDPGFQGAIPVKKETYQEERWIEDK